MNKKVFLIKVFFMYALLLLPANTATSNYFEEGKILFNKKDYIKSKILFERDLVFNPKSEKSYLFLAKIHNSNNLISFPS